jgi:hypothetical protein
VGDGIISISPVVSVVFSINGVCLVSLVDGNCSFTISLFSFLSNFVSLGLIMLEKGTFSISISFTEGGVSSILF